MLPGWYFARSTQEQSPSCPGCQPDSIHDPVPLSGKSQAQFGGNKNVYDLKNEDRMKNKGNLKNDDDVKKKDNLKKKDDLKYE